MTLAYTFADILFAWPLAFLLGVGVGLGLASRYRITKSTNGAPP